jgi:hypothetical protein
MGPPIRPSSSECISSPLRLLEGTHTSWKITCQFVYQRLLGPGWSEVPITFDRGDHPNFIPKPGRYPPVVYPIVKDVKLNRVLVDGGSSLNLLFLKTFDQMGLSRSLLRPSQAPFHGVIPGTAAMPIG